MASAPIDPNLAPKREAPTTLDILAQQFQNNVGLLNNLRNTRLGIDGRLEDPNAPQGLDYLAKYGPHSSPERSAMLSQRYQDLWKQAGWMSPEQIAAAQQQNHAGGGAGVYDNGAGQKIAIDAHGAPVGYSGVFNDMPEVYQGKFAEHQSGFNRQGFVPPEAMPAHRQAIEQALMQFASNPQGHTGANVPMSREQIMHDALMNRTGHGAADEPPPAAGAPPTSSTATAAPGRPGKWKDTAIKVGSGVLDVADATGLSEGIGSLFDKASTQIANIATNPNLSPVQKGGELLSGLGRGSVAVWNSIFGDPAGGNPTADSVTDSIAKRFVSPDITQDKFGGSPPLTPEEAAAIKEYMKNPKAYRKSGKAGDTQTRQVGQRPW